MTVDAHPLRAGILRALQVAPRNGSELTRALSQHSPRNLACAVDALVADGLIALKWGRYRLTKRGRQSLPGMSTLPPMALYKPPTVVRRAGSEVASRLPSLAGGRLIRRGA